MILTPATAPRLHPWQKTKKTKQQLIMAAQGKEKKYNLSVRMIVILPSIVIASCC